VPGHPQLVASDADRAEQKQADRDPAQLPGIRPPQEQRVQRPRQHQEARDAEDDGDLDQQRVTQPDRQHRPRVGAQESDFGRQVIRVAAQMGDRTCPIVARQPVPVSQAAGAEPGPDVSAARNRGEVRQLFQLLFVFQTLEHAKRERRAANTAAGDRQPNAPGGLHLAATPRNLSVFEGLRFLPGQFRHVSVPMKSAVSIDGGPCARRARLIVHQGRGSGP
jgi:hypothetical protein